MRGKGLLAKCTVTEVLKCTAISQYFCVLGPVLGNGSIAGKEIKLLNF